MSFFNIPTLSFFKDNVQVPVRKDTINPANSAPLPVELTGVNGDVAVNAANLNIEVQTSGFGSNPDSVRITDGVNTLSINSDGSVSSAISTANPFIEVESAVLANTEYTKTLPSNVRELSICARGSPTLRLAFIAGQTAANYITLFPGATYVKLHIVRTTPLILYYRSSKANEQIEFHYWT